MVGVITNASSLQVPGRYPGSEEGAGIASLYGMDAAALAEAGGQMDAQQQVSMLELLGLLRAVRAAAASQTLPVLDLTRRLLQCTVRARAAAGGGQHVLTVFAWR